MVNTHWPPQYIWTMGGGGSPTVMYNINVILTDGVSTTYRVRPNTVKTIYLKPNVGFSPPETITASPSSALQSYDKTDGKAVILATADVTVTGTCVKIPHTHEELKNYTHAELANYTYGQLGGNYIAHEHTKGAIS